MKKLLKNVTDFMKIQIREDLVSKTWSRTRSCYLSFDVRDNIARPVWRVIGQVNEDVGDTIS